MSICMQLILINEYLSEKNQNSVHYLSCQAVTHTVYLDFCSGHIRAFQVAGPRLWSSLPASLRQSDTTVGQFKKLLKPHLFS